DLALRGRLAAARTTVAAPVVSALVDDPVAVDVDAVAAVVVGLVAGEVPVHPHAVDAVAGVVGRVTAAHGEAHAPQADAVLQAAGGGAGVQGVPHPHQREAGGAAAGRHRRGPLGADRAVVAPHGVAVPAAVLGARAADAVVGPDQPEAVTAGGAGDG